MVDLRCVRKHAELNDGLIEIRCRSVHCGFRAGILVIHKFDSLTGELLETNRFRDPGPNATGGDISGTHNHSAAVRPA